MSVDLVAVCVFCGSNRGASPEYEQAARDVGRLLAEQGIRPVYGGASEGLMGVVADAALAAAGLVTGVMPRDLAAEEPPHQGLSELHLVGTMHERKALMAERSSAFLALPGGLGTLEEAFEAISWTQLRLQDKPTGFLNVNGFFEPTVQQLTGWSQKDSSAVSTATASTSTTSRPGCCGGWPDSSLRTSTSGSTATSRPSGAHGPVVTVP